MFKMNLQLFGGRGGASGSYSFSDALADQKRLTSLKAQISKAQHNIRISEGRLDYHSWALLGATEAGRQRVARAKKSADRDRTRLDSLIKERDQITRRLDRYRKRGQGGTF